MRLYHYYVHACARYLLAQVDFLAVLDYDVLAAVVHHAAPTTPLQVPLLSAVGAAVSGRGGGAFTFTLGGFGVGFVRFALALSGCAGGGAGVGGWFGSRAVVAVAGVHRVSASQCPPAAVHWVPFIFKKQSLSTQGGGKQASWFKARSAQRGIASKQV